MEVECGDLALRSTSTQEFTEEAPIWWHKHHVACSYVLDLLYCFVLFCFFFLGMLFAYLTAIYPFKD